MNLRNPSWHPGGLAFGEKFPASRHTSSLAASSFFFCSSSWISASRRVAFTLSSSFLVCGGGSSEQPQTQRNRLQKSNLTPHVFLHFPSAFLGSLSTLWARFCQPISGQKPLDKFVTSRLLFGQAPGREGGCLCAMGFLPIGGTPRGEVQALKAAWSQ